MTIPFQGFFKACLLMCCSIMVTHVFANSKVNVVVSILPQQYFVEKVGAERVNVQVMVGPGQNPTTYEPTPRQMAAISDADLYFTVGVPFEKAWLRRISDINPAMKVVSCCDGIHMFENHDHAHGDAGDIDPHVWTSPANVMEMVSNIEKQLVLHDNKNAELYRQSAARFLLELKELDIYIREKTASLTKRKLIVSHPSWSYFASDYGFEQISIERNGKDIMASSLKQLIEAARDSGITTVFTQPQFNDKSARVIASELKGKVIELDPLTYDYMVNMKMVTDHIVEGLADE